MNRIELLEREAKKHLESKGAERAVNISKEILFKMCECVYKEKEINKIIEKLEEE